MEKTIRVCDRCGGEGAQHIPCEGVERGVDLCAACAFAQLEQFIAGLPLVARVAFHQVLTRGKEFFPKERIFQGR